MLQKLSLEGVGPARRLEIEFGNRLSLITGDNGVGKSFLLDVAWWALTRTWPSSGRQSIPREDARKATIETTVKGQSSKSTVRKISYDFSKQTWVQPQARPQMPGLVIYAQVDGSFSVWDPARNYWQEEGQNRPAAFLFDSRQVWTGLEDHGQWRCNGLYRDWASWQREDNQSYKSLKVALEALSPPQEKLRPGLLQRISTEDSQDYPSIHMPYGIDVPLIHASAAIRRIVALAYLLIWAWNEHLLASAKRKQKPAPRVIFLIDEVEAHLHPAWQRRILPSILRLVETMTSSTTKPSIQLIASTHSPLVCVSLEPVFDPEKDVLLDLDLDPANGVRIEQVPFTKRGTGESWLLGPNFDLKTTYSEGAESELAVAAQLVERELSVPGSVKKAEFQTQDAKLRDHLPEIDSFWVRWRRVGEKRGWLK
ncbi:MAG: AAA family ATPase [Bryobacteraceae bacterium]|nr:AAA family ATPase [Bryobacteraceae bacterium]